MMGEGPLTMEKGEGPLTMEKGPSALGLAVPLDSYMEEKEMCPFKA